MPPPDFKRPSSQLSRTAWAVEFVLFVGYYVVPPAVGLILGLAIIGWLNAWGK